MSEHIQYEFDRDRYTQRDVKALLTLYPYMLDMKPQHDPELDTIISSLSLNWSEEAAIKRAEIMHGLNILSGDPPLRIDSASGRVLRYIVTGRFCIGLEYEHMANYLLREEPEMRHRRTLSPLQVARWETIGIRRLTEILNGNI